MYFLMDTLINVLIVIGYIQIPRRILCMRMSPFYRCICETSWPWSTREISGDAIPRNLSVGHPRYLEHIHLHK